MRLSTHTDYSLRVLMYLSLQQDSAPVTVQRIAEDYGVSANHIAKVAQTLAQFDYVRSVRGRYGGLVLAQPAAKIGVGQVVRAVENLQLVECFGSGSSCPIEPVCRLKNILHTAQLAFLTTLDEYTVADLVAQREGLEKLLFKSSAL